MKKIVNLVFCMVLIVSLCACGNGVTSNNKPSVDFPGVVGDIAPEDRPSNPTEIEYTASEYLATGETIWYLIDGNEGKDSNVTRIFLINPNGTLYVMNEVGYTLGELEHMDDADIASMVKTEHINQNAQIVIPLDADKQNTCSTLRSYIVSYETVYAFMRFGFQEMDIAALTESVLDSELFCRSYSTETADYYTQMRDAVREELNYFLQTWQDFCRQFIDEIIAKELFDNDEEIFGKCVNILYAPQDTFDEATAELPFSAEGIEKLKTSSAALSEACEAFYDYETADLKAFLETAQPAQYKLTIVSDPTGNNTGCMELVYKRTYRDGSAVICVEPLEYIYPAGQNHGNSTTVVYDSIYGGYYSDGDYIFTRVSENVHFTLDAVGTYDLPVDIKDRNTLFE